MAGLSISRKKGQTVVIESPGFALVMDVETIGRGKVGLKFLAPREVRIHRGELFAAVCGFDVYDRLIVEEKGTACEQAVAHGATGTGEAASGDGLPPKTCEPCVMCEERHCLKFDVEALTPGPSPKGRGEILGGKDAAETAAG